MGGCGVLLLSPVAQGAPPSAPTPQGFAHPWVWGRTSPWCLRSAPGDPTTAGSAGGGLGSHKPPFGATGLMFGSFISNCSRRRFPPQHPRCSGSALAAGAPHNFLHEPQPASCASPSTPELPAHTPSHPPASRSPMLAATPAMFQLPPALAGKDPRHPHRACLPQRHRCSTRSLTGRKRHFSSAKQCANTGSELQHCSGTETRAVRGFACLAQSWRSNF